MDISRRVIGASAVVSDDGKVIDVDLSGLIRRLLLFDKYVLVSVKLGEFPLLARYIGYEGLREAHRVIEIALLAVAGLSQRIGEMKVYSALSGFRDEELPLFRHKLDFLADATSTQNRERDFQHVMDIAGLPEFSTDDTAINVDKLLKVRESSEAREFRDWLGGIGQADEKEIRERVDSLRVKVGLAVGGKTGKLMRFLVTNAVGLIPGQQVQSLILNALDQFLLDKLLPRSGVAAFVHELYPSIFKYSEAAQAPPKHLTAVR